MTRWPVLLAALGFALGQAACGPGKPEPEPAPPPKPQPTPNVETRTLHELAASDDTDALRQALKLGQPVDALDDGHLDASEESDDSGGVEGTGTGTGSDSGDTSVPAFTVTRTLRPSIPLA